MVGATATLGGTRAVLPTMPFCGSGQRSGVRGCCARAEGETRHSEFCTMHDFSSPPPLLFFVCLSEGDFFLSVIVFLWHFVFHKQILYCVDKAIIQNTSQQNNQ